MQIKLNESEIKKAVIGFITASGVTVNEDVEITFSMGRMANKGLNANILIDEVYLGVDDEEDECGCGQDQEDVSCETPEDQVVNCWN